MSGTITYAPFIEPVTGNRELCCVSMQWQDNAGANLESVSNSCEATAKNYTRLSNGQFNFTPSSYSISVPYDRSAANVPPAVAYAEKQLKAEGKAKDDTTTFVMVNNNAETISHSHGYTSNLLDTLTTTFYHEVGRDDPTILGSSGAYLDGKYEDQADGTSFMSHFASNNITASQLYYLGWLPNTQVALYTDTTTATEFVLDPLDQENSAENLKAVLMPNVAGKPLFLSRPRHKDGIFYALHLASGHNNKGSERLALFTKQTDYNGLSFEQISEEGSTATVRISPQAKP